MSQQKLGSLIQFRNCRILRNHRIYTDDLWVRDGKIINPEKVFFDEKIPADVQVDCKNTIIAPGFIDVQLNGEYMNYRYTHSVMNFIFLCKQKKFVPSSLYSHTNMHKYIYI